MTEEFCSSCFNRPATNRARCRKCFTNHAIIMVAGVIVGMIMGVIGWRVAHPMLGIPVFFILSGWSVAWFWTRGNKEE